MSNILPFRGSGVQAPAVDPHADFRAQLHRIAREIVAAHPTPTPSDPEAAMPARMVVSSANHGFKEDLAYFERYLCRVLLRAPKRAEWPAR